MAKGKKKMPPEVRAKMEEMKAKRGCVSKTKKGIDTMYDLDRAEQLYKGRGEGSRGGHVVGHTERGKPVYSTGGGRYRHMKAVGAAYPKFDLVDHKQAARVHAKAMETATPKAAQAHRWAHNMHQTAAAMLREQKGQVNWAAWRGMHDNKSLGSEYAIKSLLMMADAEGIDLEEVLGYVEKSRRVGNDPGDSQIAGARNGATLNQTRGGAHNLERQRTVKPNHVRDGAMSTANEGDMARTKGRMAKSMFPVNQSFSLVHMETSLDQVVSSRIEAGPIPEAPRRNLGASESAHPAADWDGTSTMAGVC